MSPIRLLVAATLSFGTAAIIAYKVVLFFQDQEARELAMGSFPGPEVYGMNGDTAVALLCVGTPLLAAFAYYYAVLIYGLLRRAK